MNKNFIKNAASVSSITLLSRFFGFARDFFIAKVLGAGRMADAFFVAFKIPNMFRAIFAEGAFNSVFVPAFAREARSGVAGAREYSRNIFAHLFWMLAAFTVAAEFFMERIVLLFAPGFAAEPDTLAAAAGMARIIFPFLGLIALTSFFGGILNSLGRFAPYAATPIIMNICMLIAAMVSVESSRAGFNLSYAVTLSGMISLFVLWRFAGELGFGKVSLRPRLTDGARRIFRNIVPGIAGAGVYHIQVLVGGVFASAIAGATSWIYYADRLVQLPLGVIGVSVATILLPGMSGKERDGGLFNWSLAFAMGLVLPAAVLLWVFADPLISLFFRHGEFVARDAEATARALRILCVGLPALVASRLFQNVFYARQDTRTPMNVAAASLCVYAAAAGVLSRRFGYLGIVAAISMANWAALAGLWALCRRKKLMELKGSTLWRIGGMIALNMALGWAAVRAELRFDGGIWGNFASLACAGAAYAAACAPITLMLLREKSEKAAPSPAS
jgi:putative peptidoglycan lipid II flippase